MLEKMSVDLDLESFLKILMHLENRGVHFIIYTYTFFLSFLFFSYYLFYISLFLLP
jgi:hypothetical protein